jgi:coenzyme PQQ precursor peptide PqqA
MTAAPALEPSVSKQLPLLFREETTMNWVSPRIVEIAVGLEVTSYVSAEWN